MLPSADGRTPTAEIPVAGPRRHPLTWPLVAIVSLLAVAVLATLLVFILQPTQGDDEPTGTPTAPTPTATTPSATPTSDMIRIDEDDYIGRPYAEVRDALVGFGLVVSRADGPAAPEPALEGTVSSVDPVGNMRPGRDITVFVYRAYVPPPAPTTPSASPGPYTAGDEVTITAPNYTGCPAGRALTGYQFSLVNATFTSGGNPIGPGPVSFGITLGDPGEATVSYVATCEGGHTSAHSGTLSLTVG